MQWLCQIQLCLAAKFFYGTNFCFLVSRIGSYALLFVSFVQIPNMMVFSHGGIDKIKS